MRTYRQFFALALVSASIFAVNRLRADWILSQDFILPGPNFAVSTVGGITYLQYTCAHYTLAGTNERLAEGPLWRGGTNLTQEVDLEVPTGTNIITIPEQTYTTKVWNGCLVLGTLAPGDYQLQWRSSYSAFFGPPSTIMQVIPFTIAANTNTTNPTLLSASLSSGTIRIQTLGVSNATYIVQRSLDLTNWTAIATNVGGPFDFSEPTSGTNAFYRVLIGNGHTSSTGAQ